MKIGSQQESFAKRWGYAPLSGTVFKMRRREGTQEARFAPSAPHHSVAPRNSFCLLSMSSMIELTVSISSNPKPKWLAIQRRMCSAG